MAHRRVDLRVRAGRRRSGTSPTATASSSSTASEIDSLYGKVREKGLTLVPTRMYFKDGRVKVEIALARGRERADKRRVVAERDAQREIERALKRRRVDPHGRWRLTMRAPRRITLAGHRGEGESMRRVALTANGVRHDLEIEPRELLVYVLRERLGLTGTNVGCDTSSCGACTVLVNGESVKSCTMLGVQADGMEITTIEGLATNGELHPVQQAFHDHHALQCGYCTPGMVLAAVSLIDSGAATDEAAIREGLEGNLCRCTGYHNIVEAVAAAAGVAS